MLAAIRSAAVVGVDAYDVTVEVDAARSLPKWTVVGLAAGAVKEAMERVAAALANSGYTLPPRRITVNLAPADVRKDGTAFDLPIALGVLAATGQLDPSVLDDFVVLGELGLDGSLRAVRGVLPVAMRLSQTEGDAPSPRAIIVPPANLFEARLVTRIRSVAPPTLTDLIAFLHASLSKRQGIESTWEPSLRDIAPNDSSASADPPSTDAIDLADVVGQETAKRALEVAAAGGHALLMVGPPGGGKTMLARRLATILPPLTSDESLEVLAVQSVAGLLPRNGTHSVQRPFRAPHHTLSVAALIGGGSHPRPGEVTLAHLGVLFLDELQEMPRSVLDALRQPMEDGRVFIARAQQSVAFPARFALVGAMNPCPCGQAGSDANRCTCSPIDVARHRARVSGPLSDRIDMTIQVPPVAIDALRARSGGESSATVRARVVDARARQTERYRRLRRVNCNAQAHGRWLDAHSLISQSARDLLVLSAERLALSARGYHRVLKVARTIADLEAADAVERHHIAEALFFRLPEKLPVLAATA